MAGETSLLQYVRAQDMRSLLALGAALAALWLISDIVYNIFLHPLRKIPGPFFAKISNIWVARHWIGGRYVYAIHEAHEKYGPVVRTGRNEVSFCAANAWKDIYGHVSGRKAFLKSDWYSIVPEEIPHVSSARDPALHSVLRKTFSHGFSAKALSEQEGIVQGFVDLFIVQLAKNCTKEVSDVVRWYNFVTFDIIGELTFGEPFGSLSSGKLHFWVQMLFEVIKSGTLYRSLLWFPRFQKLSKLLYSYSFLPKQIVEARKKHNLYARNQMDKRLADRTDRYDFLSRPIKILNDGSAGEQLSVGNIRSTGNLLIVAGSETTATALSGITFYLGHNPRIYLKLATEIREKFGDYKEINGLSTENMPYLRAVIEEGLRLYPPVPIGMPRVSPGETVEGHFLPQGTIAYVSSWSATHHKDNFVDPFEFIPERWIGKNTVDKKEASQPFLTGSRVCLGRNLALLEIRLILTKLFYCFDFELGTEVGRWDMANNVYLVWEKPQLPVRFTRRQNVVMPGIDGWPA